MSKVFKKNKFTNISNVLPRVAADLGLDKRLNEQAMFCLWSSILGETYAVRSIPLYIDGQNNLIVAVEDSSTAQELSFLKPKLIKKLKELGVQFGLDIDGLRFDLKQFAAVRKQRADASQYPTVSGDNIALGIKNEQLSNINLSQEELDEIQAFKDAMSNATLVLQELSQKGGDLIAQRVANLVEKRLRLKKWHKSNNLPFCNLCQEPLFQMDVILCPYCLQHKQAH